MIQTTVLQAHEVSLTYRALPALRHINWRIDEGEQWACIGPNGSGKTSLAKVLSGQAGHYAGTLELAPNLHSEGVAYVCFEQARALCQRDARFDDSEFRADACDPGTRVRDLLPDTDAQSLAGWLERLRLEHVMERGLRFISTGEMRKCLLLCAILSRPGLLILDSPLDGLDRASQQEMHSIIAELQASGQRLLLLCRDLDDLPPGCSHLLVLDEGQQVASGPRSEVLAEAAVQTLMRPPQPPLGEIPAPAPRQYTLPAGEALLVLRNVNVSFGDTKVLDEVNWTLARGQHCAITGPNGCGKTTLLSLITGDSHKAYGQDITLFGRRRGSGESVWEIKQKYGQLDTQLHLSFSSRMGVLEVVVSGFFDSIGLYDEAGDTQRHAALDWLAALGLRERAKEQFGALSFGLQRMVLLARAMVKNPAILLLDEPTLGLDSHHRALMLRAIDHIAAATDTQIIFVSHCAGHTPACINQHLRFEPAQHTYRLRCEQAPARR